MVKLGTILHLQLHMIPSERMLHIWYIYIILSKAIIFYNNPYIIVQIHTCNAMCSKIAIRLEDANLMSKLYRRVYCYIGHGLWHKKVFCFLPFLFLYIRYFVSKFIGVLHSKNTGGGLSKNNFWHSLIFQL